MTNLWEKLESTDFADIAGTVIEGVIPIRETLIRASLVSLQNQQRLLAGVQIRIQPDNRIEISYQLPAKTAASSSGLLNWLKRAANAVLSAATVDVELKPALDPNGPKLSFRTSALGTVASMLAGSRIALSRCGNWDCIDLSQFPAVRQRRRLLEHFQSVDFKTAPGVLFIQFRLHIPERRPQ